MAQHRHAFNFHAGPDAYEVPEDKQEKEGVLLYEIPFPGISGMDYSNNITSDGRWCIETREVYKAWFPNDTALDDFVNHRIVPQSILTLAGAVAAQVVGCLRAEVPAPAQEQCLVWLRAVSVERCDTADAASTERRHLRWLAEEVCDSVHGDGGDGDGDGDAAMQDRQSEDGTASLQSPLPATWAGRPRSTFMKRSLSDSMLGQRSDAASSDSEASAAEPENVEPPAPPVEFSLIHTNLVVLYFGDDSAPLLPFSLWKILMDKNNSEYLRQVESGLPSWCMFLSQRNIYYRTWYASQRRFLLLLPYFTWLSYFTSLCSQDPERCADHQYCVADCDPHRCVVGPLPQLRNDTRHCQLRQRRRALRRGHGLHGVCVLQRAALGPVRTLRHLCVVSPQRLVAERRADSPRPR